MSELTEQQRQVVAWVAGGMPGPQAFRKAGFAPSYARKAATVLKRPIYVAALERERAVLREQLPFSAAAAVMEINQQIRGALAGKVPNHMAAAKLLDLKCRVYGLIREKIEVVTVDLSGAIERAKVRVLNGPPPCSDVAGTIRWAASIPGGPVAEDPDAGPAEPEPGLSDNKVEPENR